MPYHILFKGIYFVLSYKFIKNGTNEACLKQRQNTFNCFEKITKRWCFMNLNRPWKKIIIGCIFGKLWNLSTFSLLPEKPNNQNPRNFLYRFEHAKFVLILKCNTVLCRIFSFLKFVITSARCGKGRVESYAIVFPTKPKYHSAVSRHAGIQATEIKA